MIIEDACERNQKAVDRLLARRGKARLRVKQVVTLSEFLRCAQMQKLSRRDKERLVDQAILMVDQFYPHLPFKRARYAIDPVQRLRLLRANLGHGGDEMSFHSELLQSFAEMRDPHTFYQLPSPYQGSVAFPAASFPLPLTNGLSVASRLQTATVCRRPPGGRPTLTFVPHLH